MQTVTFQCGHCGNLMAVVTDYLGQEVRCPHCEQVVLAPKEEVPGPEPSAAPGPAEVSFSPPPAVDHEDIFTPPEAEGEDLFGGPTVPRLEIPSEPASAQSLPSTNGSTPPPGPADGSASAATLMYPPPDGPSAPPEGAAAGPVPDWMAPPAEGMPAEAAAPTTQEAPAEEAPPDLVAPRPRPARRSSGGAWFLALVVIPLISYSILATAAAVLLYLRLQQAPPSLFEQMPDVNGDTPGVHKAEKTSWNLRFDERRATAPLPDKLHVPLGRTLRIGDLEVTPTKVERKRVRVYVEGTDKPEPCQHDSLVLHLRLRNVSASWAFTPLDNYFDRNWKSRKGPPPLTQLEVGSRRFFGGPASWYPLRRSDRDNTRREWVQGRKNYDPEGLKPGAEMETFVCTDGDDARVVPAVRSYPGTLLWRVQLRRGLVRYNYRDYPATAVVGVEFTRENIEKNPGHAG